VAICVGGQNGPVGEAREVDGDAAAGKDVDALLLLTFGGPDGPDDVLPFLRNVTRGRGVPQARIAQVAEHYHRLGGRSPINDQSRALLAALRAELAPLPVYWGNRNWEPYLGAALAEMRADGVRRAAVFVPSVFASYSGCRQYRENLADGLAALAAEGPGPELLKLRVFFDHPGFVEPMVDRVVAGIESLPAQARDRAHLVFVAHSVPERQAAESGPDGNAYPAQLLAVSRAVVDGVAARRATSHGWDVAYCSRSGPPTVRWLTPDVGDRLEQLAAAGSHAVVIVPIGFVSDHMEVIQDLDREAMGRAEKLGLLAVRAGTVGTDPRFVRMVAQLLDERREPGAPRRSCVDLGPFPVVCPTECCAAPAAEDRRPAAGGTQADARGLGRPRLPAGSLARDPGPAPR
jgi:ferrochelatase